MDSREIDGRTRYVPCEQDSSHRDEHRISGIMSIIHREDTTHLDTGAAGKATMDAATNLSPKSTHPSGPPPPYSSTWSNPAPPSGLISPPGSRRTSDNSNHPPSLQLQTAPAQRQSLPSIHEALSSGSSGPRSSAYVSPVSASQTSSHAQPFAFAQHTAPRIFGAEHGAYVTQAPPSQVHRSSPPQSIRPSPYAQIESSNPFSDNPRRSIQHDEPIRPLNGHLTSRYGLERQDPGYRAPPPPSNGYMLHPPRPPHGPYSREPPRPDAISPQTSYPAQQSEPLTHAQALEKVRIDQNQAQVNQGTDGWDLEHALYFIRHNSKMIFDWSSDFYIIAREQQDESKKSHERMPTMESCLDMIAKQRVVTQGLENLKIVIEQTNALAADQRLRQQGQNAGLGGFGEDMAGYDKDLRSEIYANNDGKKRKGRAAPPGRCHSCNRAETPEWRRGPDGARTLCNACGLHYAKLTRKTTNSSKQVQGVAGSSLPPNPRDENHTRPV